MSPKVQAIIDAFGDSDTLLSSELRARCTMQGSQFHTGMNQLRNKRMIDSCRTPGGEVRYWLVRSPSWLSNLTQAVIQAASAKGQLVVVVHNGAPHFAHWNAEKSQVEYQPCPPRNPTGFTIAGLKGKQL